MLFKQITFRGKLLGRSARNGLISVLAPLHPIFHPPRHSPRYFQRSRVLLNGLTERQEPRIGRISGAVNTAQKDRVFIGHFNSISELLRGVIEIQLQAGLSEAQPGRFVGFRIALAGLLYTGISSRIFA